MPLKVMFIDDEIDICEVFADEFSSEDIHITTFIDPNKAIAEAKRMEPDVVFIDYRIPGTNGDKVAQALAGHIPKYLFTGEINPKTDYKFAAIFGKPPQYDSIRTLLDNLHLSKKSN